jgi:hypothetical protein
MRVEIPATGESESYTNGYFFTNRRKFSVFVKPP